MLAVSVASGDPFPQSTLMPLSYCSESDVKQLWLQLKKDEPHLLSSFEDFLTRIFSQLQEAQDEKTELECALKKWVPSFGYPLCTCVKDKPEACSLSCSCILCRLPVAVCLRSLACGSHKMCVVKHLLACTRPSPHVRHCFKYFVYISLS